jgi:hypothetical protein
MDERPRFAYAQARLQARHGARPDEQLWRRLASLADLGGFLDTARRTVLRPWVEGMQVAQSHHTMELLLRQRFRDYADEVAQWLPARWGATLHWIRRLPDLPALQHLLTGGVAQSWMLDDPALQGFATIDMSRRQEAMRQSGSACLLSAWQRGTPLPAAWIEQWQRLWPTERGRAAGLVYLGRLLHMYAAPAALPVHRRTILLPGLNQAFRRYAFQPAAACAHLGLVALDLERLRGELLGRALFSGNAGSAT